MGGAHRLTPHSLFERYLRPVEQDPVRAGRAGTGSAGDDASRAAVVVGAGMALGLSVAMLTERWMSGVTFGISCLTA